MDTVFISNLKKKNVEKLVDFVNSNSMKIKMISDYEIMRKLKIVELFISY